MKASFLREPTGGEDEAFPLNGSFSKGPTGGLFEEEGVVAEHSDKKIKLKVWS